MCKTSQHGVSASTETPAGEAAVAEVVRDALVGNASAYIASELGNWHNSCP